MDFSSISSIEEFDYLAKEVVWQNFEKLTAFIFEQNDYNVIINKVLTKKNPKTKKLSRRQYDIIATKNNKTYLIECKKWSGHRYRLSGIKTAVKQHKERLNFYCKNQKINKTNITPLIVTLIEETIQSYEGVYIIPISKLNSFLNQI